MAYRQPKWVMCMCCGEVIYGGPSKFGVPRVCGGKVLNPTYDPTKEGQLKWLPCLATAVYMGANGKVIVKWDKDWYQAYGQSDSPDIEYADDKLPDMSRVAVEETTIDDAVSGHLGDMFGENYG